MAAMQCCTKPNTDNLQSDRLPVTGSFDEANWSVDPYDKEYNDGAGQSGSFLFIPAMVRILCRRFPLSVLPKIYDICAL